MNKVILMGRLTRDPEVRYSQGAEPIAICKFSIAVNRRYKKEGEPEADFFNCTSFGKTGEFTSKYFKKGQMISLVGRLSVNSWTDQNGQKRTSTEVVVEEQYFAEKKSNSSSNNSNNNEPAYEVDTSVDDDNLPW